MGGVRVNADRLCSECDDLHYARGLCKRHYRRLLADQRGHAVQYDRERRGTDEYRAAERERYLRRKDKKAANNALYRAVEKGEVVRESCEVCGSPDSQGHHEDYSRPLEVRWLCLEHHVELHHPRGRVAVG